MLVLNSLFSKLATLLNGVVISHIASSLNLKISGAKFENIKKNMEIHQDIEYLEYWELIGEGETSEELTLVARLCDSIYINHENGVLELILKKIL